MGQTTTGQGLRVGWAQGDITPTEPVLVCGQFHARVSTGVKDPLTVTALAIQNGPEQAVLVSCDLICISDELRDGVRAILAAAGQSIEPGKVVLNATHTHTGPEVCLYGFTWGDTVAEMVGIDLPVMPVQKYQRFAVERITAVIVEAWRSLAPGAVSYGLGHAVVSRNRRWTDTAGRSTMYGNTNTPEFSHIEGSEDHSVNFLAVHDAKGALTGLVVNVPCPSQVNEGEHVLSADYWADTRLELRRRFGKDLYVLPQCSAAGDLSPHLIFEKRSARRMLELHGRSECQEIAVRIADAVEGSLAAVAATRDAWPCLSHHVELLQLPMAQLTAADAEQAGQEARAARQSFEKLMREIEADPTRKSQPYWFHAPTAAYCRAAWYESVVKRFDDQKNRPTFPVELHVIRLGDVAIATLPFEYYLDFGIHIKARSKATQTFIVQLAGSGSYVPSARSMAGGGYGSIPASNPVDAKGGWQLAHRIVGVLDELWSSPK